MRLILSAVLALITLPICAQITFVPSTTTWKQLSAQAKAENKLIFIHLENTSCEQCNEVASQGFSSPMLKEKFDKNFISIRCNVDTENGFDLKRKFEIQSSLISLFVDPEGNILNRNNGSTSAYLVYDEQADLAISRKGSKNVNDYTKEYRSGERSQAFMKEYIVKLRESQLSSDNVLDEYVKSLPDDSLNNFGTIRFIYNMGPALDSKTFDRIRALTRRDLADSMFRSIPYSEAVAMNNAIINSSFRNAVMKRDVRLARQVAAFTETTYSENPAQGKIAYERTMINYHHSVRDIPTYLKQTTRFIEQFYINVDIDSLKTIDSLEVRKRMPVGPIPRDGITVRSFAVSPPSQYYHLELNNRAWHFYQLATEKDDLEKALSWSKLSIDLSKKLMRSMNNTEVEGSPSYMDTYAHLLYKLDRRDEAIEWQTKTIETIKIMGQPSGSFETTLAKMKAGTL